MSDHTPEPWRVDLDRQDEALDIWADDEDNYPVAIAKATDPECAARIVACVNACAGIPTERLGDVKALITAATTTARGLLATSHVEAKAGNDVMAADCEDYAMRLNAALAPFVED